MPANMASQDTRSKVARSVLRKNMQVRPGERVTVEGWTHTLPWAVSFAREARRLGALPLVPYEDEGAYWDAVEDGEDKVLGATPAHEWAALGKTDVYLHMWGPGDRVRTNSLPERRQRRLTGFNDAWYRAAAKAGLRGARLELGRPYPTLAKAYGVDETKWRNEIVAATLVTPEKLRRIAAPLLGPLGRGKRLRIRDHSGTDLTLGLKHRRVRVGWGRLNREDMSSRFGRLLNLPSGGIRVALDEGVAEETIVGNRTCYYDDGKATEAVFRFHGGKLVERSFASGGDRFEDPFAKAGKGRDRPGFLGIGLNPELHNTPQVEDLERGAVMVSVGGNRHLGGTNGAEFFGWAINSGASVEVDGRPLEMRRG